MPSSVEDFQRSVIGNGTTSVMQNSRTLKAGDRIAHYTQTHTHTHTQTGYVGSSPEAACTAISITLTE